MATVLGLKYLFAILSLSLFLPENVHGSLFQNDVLINKVLKFNSDDVLNAQRGYVVNKPNKNIRKKRDVSESSVCKDQEQNFLQAVTASTNGFLNKYTFLNESKYSMALAWGGEANGKIVVSCTEEMFILAKKSDLYQSNDYGKTFVNINGRINNAQVRKDNGLQKHPHKASRLYIVGHTQTMHSDLHITEDGGDTFEQPNRVPFMLAGELIFHPSPDRPDYIMANCSISGELFLSKDAGRSWNKLRDHAVHFKWSTSEDEDKKDTIYIAINPTNFWKDTLHLMKSKDLGKTWELIHEDVYSFGIEGKFLYVSVNVPGKNERRLKVSTTEGKNWYEVQLPTIVEDRFYSILDSSEGLVFMHVDNPGDTGDGTLYTSDGSGIIFDESLRKHLYPNGYVDLTDFYKVKSIRGVYLASQMGEGNSIHTRISYNRGATWNNIPRPEGLSCTDESKGCYLQIHNIYSMVKNVRAERPLSIENAPGIILVHGHVANALQITEPDVYVSNDGGYTWYKSLDGPHHYQIADNGGLLVAVPSHTDTPNVVKFSTDEGRCWHEYRFTDEEVLFTGLLTEPGNSAMSVSIWGFGKTDRIWRTYTIDFEKVVIKQCESSDYDTWVPHWDYNEGDKFQGCLLGLKETFKKLKRDSWCKNGRSYRADLNKEEVQCECTRDDYECDYGYYRPVGSEACIKDSKFKTDEFEVCYMGHEEEIVSEGYRKVPGDKCTNEHGGFKPPVDKLIDLKEKCSDGNKYILKEELTDEYLSRMGVDEASHRKNVSRAAWIVVILISLLLLVITTAFFIHRCHILKKNSPSYRYSVLHQTDGMDHDVENTLHNNTSLYDDDDADDFFATLTAGTTADLGGAAGSNALHKQEKSSIKPQSHAGYGVTANTKPAASTVRAPPANQPNGKVRSYHDDSDVDLLED